MCNFSVDAVLIVFVVPIWSVVTLLHLQNKSGFDWSNMVKSLIRIQINSAGGCCGMAVRASSQQR